jgi:hypothetical protein
MRSSIAPGYRWILTVGIIHYSLFIGPQMPMITPIFDILHGPIFYICVQFIRGRLIERRRVESIWEYLRRKYNSKQYILDILIKDFLLVSCSKWRLHFFTKIYRCTLLSNFFKLLAKVLAIHTIFDPLILSQLFPSTFSLTQLAWTDSYTLDALSAGQGVCCKEWQGVCHFHLLINKYMSIYCASHLRYLIHSL